MVSHFLSLAVSLHNKGMVIILALKSLAHNPSVDHPQISTSTQTIKHFNGDTSTSFTDTTHSLFHLLLTSILDTFLTDSDHISKRRRYLQTFVIRNNPTQRRYQDKEAIDRECASKSVTSAHHRATPGTVSCSCATIQKHSAFAAPNVIATLTKNATPVR